MANNKNVQGQTNLETQAKNTVKGKQDEVLVESWETAPLAYDRGKKPVSGITMPNEDDVRNAKDYVDANQK